MNTKKRQNEASTGSARPSSIQKDSVEITADTPDYMQRHGWKMGGTTNDQTALAAIKWGYQEEGFAVAFTWATYGSDVIYWIHDGEIANRR